ncbi:MAG TPA: class II glutamine amidotransferase [Polyangiaceae bacterium]|nr:class II glutamine amidotransferase [Polyangiaceae bacterium]
MCRLFGFRSVIPSQVHRSLVAADNALGVQSNKHPDGWGVAFYVDGVPHVTRSPMTALGDALFHRLSGLVASQTVLAHVRQATQGKNDVLNCHPFQYGRWVGAHNGDVPNLSSRREALLAEIAPHLRRFVLGETDSELIFFMVLTRLEASAPLHARRSLAELVAALRATVTRVRELCDDEANRALLTLLITDGESLVAVQGGKPLFYSTHKNRCADRDVCPSLSEVCEAPSRTGYVNHLIVSSERLQGENVWMELGEGEILGVDSTLRVMLGSVSHPSLPVLCAAG